MAYTVISGKYISEDEQLEETLAVLPLDVLKSVYLIKKSYYDNNYLDLRVFFNRKDGTKLPSKKGVILSVEQWKELLPGILRGLGIELANVE